MSSVHDRLATARELATEAVRLLRDEVGDLEREALIALVASVASLRLAEEARRDPAN